MPIAIECSFDADGWVRVRRVRLDDRWHMVEQGRQWADEQGKHVLVLLPAGVAGGVRELLLRADTLTWEMRELPGGRQVV